MRSVRAWLVLASVVVVSTSCSDPQAASLTISGSALGAEGAVLRQQLARFRERHPGVTVEAVPTPDAADQRHQLYVQRLNARAPDPDVLQLDVIWTAEFAGAGWILPLDRFAPDVSDFVPAAVTSSRWRGRQYAMPWFVDLGLLYRRTDLVADAPESLAELRTDARGTRTTGAARYGLVWQGARYEGLVTVFLEHLVAFGGRILDESGRVVVDQPAAVRALTFMCDTIASGDIVPASVLTWQEEQTRFAFQNGEAVFMRNWPYAWALLQDAQRSRVAGRVAVSAFPAADGGRRAAALGGAQLAINAYSRHPDLAWALVQFLTAPEQMQERARVAAQLPPRRSLYEASLAVGLPLPPDQVRDLLDAAVARPVTPVYTELSELLQVRLHRALSRQESPEAALHGAAEQIRGLLQRSQLTPESTEE